MNNYKYCAIIIIALFLTLTCLYSQEKKVKSGSLKKNDIIKIIEDGIVKNNINSFSRYFDRNIFLTLRDDESGYFSANQAEYILQNYFDQHRLIKFNFSTVDVTKTPFYATGGAIMSYKGSIEQTQIYVSLTYVKGIYLITQFCIY